MSADRAASERLDRALTLIVDQLQMFDHYIFLILSETSGFTSVLQFLQS